MMTYLKHVGHKKHSDLKTKTFEEIQGLYEQVKRFDNNFTAIGTVEDEKMLDKVHKKIADKEENQVLKESESTEKESKEEEGTRKRKSSTRKKMMSRKRRYRKDTSQEDSDDDALRLCLTVVPDEDKEVDYEMLDKKYPIIEWKSVYIGIKPQPDEVKDIEESNQNSVIKTKGFDRILWGDLMIMFNQSNKGDFWDAQQDWKIVCWKLHSSSGVHTLITETETEEDSTMALELIRVLNSPCFMVKSWLVQDQTVLVQKQTDFGKDKSNPLIVGSLLKTIRLSIHLVVYNEELAILEQTTTSKGTSNPFLAGSLPKTTNPT
ncbi:hypothetical protein Tco_0833849 [Tanacetum coccineum]